MDWQVVLEMGFALLLFFGGLFIITTLVVIKNRALLGVPKVPTHL